MNAWRVALTTLALVTQAAAAQTVAFISDLNGRYGGTEYSDRVTTAIDRIVSLQPGFVICTGDMVAGQSQPRLDADWLDRMWAGFNQTVTQPLADAGIPFLVTPGNHDASAYDEFALERERFQAQWKARPPALGLLPGSQWPRRYAIEADGLLLIGFDGTRPGRVDPEDFSFVRDRLQAHGGAARATLVFSHLPMWPLASGRETDIITDRDFLALLHDHGVDVYASGHHHAFYAGIDEAGMVHLGVGALGGNARRFANLPVEQPFSYALLTIADGQVRVESRADPGFTRPVPADGLPARIGGPLGPLQRLDGPAPLRR